MPNFIIKNMYDYIANKDIYKEVTDFSIVDGIYYHGTSNDIDDDFIFNNKIKEYPEYSTSWSLQVQGLGKFYTESLENAYSFIDFSESKYGNIAKVSFKPKKSYDVKNIVKLMTILEKFGESENINSIPDRNKKFVEYLIDLGYDSIIFKEGPRYNPTSTKLRAKVIIPLVTDNVKLLDVYIGVSRNGGIFKK